MEASATGSMPNSGAGSPRKQSRSSRLRIGLLGLLAALFLIGLFYYREVSRGERYLVESDLAFHRNDLVESLRKAKSAAMAFAPGAPHVEAAYERLRAIARGAEAEGDLNLSFQAWDAIRHAHAETRYPGRAPSPIALEAEEALSRLKTKR